MNSLKDVRFGYDIENFFSQNDPSVKFYETFREEFENENDYLIIGLTNDEGIFNESFLNKVDKLTSILQKDTNIRRVFSPTNVSRQVKTPFLGFTSIPAIHVNDPTRYEDDRKRVYDSEDHIASLFSSDGTSIRLVLKLNSQVEQKAGFELLGDYKRKVSKFKFDEVHFAGRLETQEYYINAMQAEMKLFVGLALAIVIITLIIVMNSIRYSLLSLLTISFAIVSTFGAVGMSGIEINLMLILMPAILLIIGASSSIHFFSDVSHNLQQYPTKQEAIRVTLRNTGLPIFFNVLTTSAGFFSLALIPVKPIQYFGILTGMGILIVFIFLISIGIASSFLLSSPLKGIRPMIELPRIKQFRKKGLVGGSLLVILIFLGSFSSSHLDISNHFLEDLKDDSSLKNGLSYFETHFGGIRPLEIIVNSKTGESIENLNFLRDLEVLENEIESIFEVEYVISPINLVRSINRSLHADNKDYYELPKNESDLKRVMSIVENKNLQSTTKNMISNLGIRFSSRVRDFGSKTLDAKNAQLSAFVTKNLPNIEIQFTGAAHLMDQANSKLAKSLIYGLLLAMAISLLCVLIITRSFRLTILSLIPNILPLLFATSIMWIFEVPLNMGTAMIFSIVFGLAVDDTLHFIFRYHRLRKDYKNSSIPRTVLLLRRPMIGTSLVLGLGFLVFGFSGFTSISIMGIIVGLSLFVALVTDFYLLPILLNYRFSYRAKANCQQSEIERVSPFSHPC